MAVAYLAPRTHGCARHIDFTATDGGFTSESLVGTDNPWGWTSGTGWTVANISSVSRQRLLSPVLTASGTAWGVVASHAFNFEPRSSGCFDGGALFVNVNGGGFTQVTSGITGTAYTGPVSSSFANPLGGLSAFCGVTAGLVSTTLSGTANAGDTFQFAFDGGWDSSVRGQDPAWLLNSLELRGFGGTATVPEPGSIALLAGGLLGMGVVARRRRTT